MILPEHHDDCEIDALTSEYLDSVCSDDRVAQLSKLLESRKDCREQFVAQVQMHGMLCDYFKTRMTQADDPAVVTDANAQVLPPRRKRRGRSNAA